MTFLQRLFAAAALLAVSQPLVAGQVDLLLEIDYAGPGSASGGSWRLIASTDEQGLFGLRVPLEQVSGTAVTSSLPTGRVNGSLVDNAGFTTFVNAGFGSSRDLFFGQVNSQISAAEQGIFYGVGTLINGSPSFPGQPVGTTSTGPTLSTLTNVTGVPWGLEPGLTGGVEVATGAFDPGQIPEFNEFGIFQASLFTTTPVLATQTGLTTNEVTFTTEVVDDLVFGVATGDYNGDGVVNTADYAVYRDSFNSSVTPLSGADGDGDGLITENDRQVWLRNLGRVGPPSPFTAPLSLAVSIPEPSTWLLLAPSALLAWGGRSSRPSRRGATADREN